MLDEPVDSVGAPAASSSACKAFGIMRRFAIALTLALSALGCQSDESVGEGGANAPAATTAEGAGRPSIGGQGDPDTGQNPTLLTDGCPSCRILFDTVVILGDPVGPGMIDGWGLMAVDPAGRYYISNGNGSELKVFSPDGRFLRTLGRSGQGPGEFGMFRGLHVDTSGNLYLPDVINARVTVFDSTGALVRTVPVHEPLPGFTVLPLPGDSLLMEGPSLAPHLVGYSTHVISPEGARVRSFGEPPYAIPPGDPYYDHRALAWAGPGEVWIGGWHRYYIERWSLAGTRIRTFVREAEWFPIPVSGARPFLSSMQQDSSGLLWVQAHIPAPYRADDPGDGRDSVVEVIDPAAGQVLASARLHGHATGLFGDRLTGFVVTDLNRGLVQMVVLRARLDDPQ